MLNLKVIRFMQMSKQLGMKTKEALSSYRM